VNSSWVFARKEVLEIRRTWRIWVLPAVVLFFAATGPPLARFTPELINSIAGDQLGQLRLPTPTYRDSYAQWTKNLSQIIMFVLIIIYGSLVSSEVKSGTAVFALSKPLSRTAFVTVKAVVHCCYVAGVLAAGTLMTWAGTAAVFGEAPGRPLWTAAGLLLVLSVLFVTLMTLLSVAIPSTAGAAGAGVGIYAVLSIGAIWKPLSSYSPAGLAGYAASIAAGTGEPSVLWPVTTSVVISAAAVALAAALFRRKEL
jgi:ABC-2 type transport system permease protein